MMIETNIHFILISTILFLSFQCASSHFKPTIHKRIEERRKNCQYNERQLVGVDGDVHTLNTEALEDTARMVLSRIDLRVDPCEDFFQFSCGKLLKDWDIPDKKVMTLFSHGIHNIIHITQGRVHEYGIGSRADDLMQSQYKDLFHDLKTDRKYNGTVYQLVRDGYHACMDTERLEALGVTPLLEELKSLGLWPEPFQSLDWEPDSDVEWFDYIYKIRAFDGSTAQLINFHLADEESDNSKRIIWLDQLPFLETMHQWVENDAYPRLMQALRIFYFDLFIMLGVDVYLVPEIVEKIIDFWGELVKISDPREKRKTTKDKYNLTTVKELTKLHPGISWLKYISKMLGKDHGFDLNADTKIVVPNTKYIKMLRPLLKDTPMRELLYFIVANIANNALPYLDQKAEGIKFNLDMVLSGQTKKPPRWKICVEEMHNDFGILTASLYVRKHFDEHSKLVALEMLDAIRESFMETLNNIDWMDPATKDKAMVKARAMQVHTGYPEELLDLKTLIKIHSGIKIKPTTHYQNKLNTNIHKVNKDATSRKVEDWIDYARHTDTVNAYNCPWKNAIQIPAGILTSVMFNSERPKYMNFGAIGFVMGHEITHGFDSTGRHYNEDGNLEEWWHKETAKIFKEKAKCFEDQYSKYSYPNLKLRVDGNLTLGENIADNGGIRAAYKAYKAWQQCYGREQQLPGINLTPEQMFWVSAGIMQCGKYKDKALAQFLRVDTHTPNDFRLKGLVSNQEDFVKDFGCKDGSPMNRKNKCKIW